MIAAAEAGVLTLEKLEAMTAVCSVGLDMICIPGDTTAETISGIIADEIAIGMVNGPPTWLDAMTPPFFTASLSMASAAVVPGPPQTSSPMDSRMQATLSPTAGVGASDRSTMP